MACGSSADVADDGGPSGSGSSAGEGNGTGGLDFGNEGGNGNAAGSPGTCTNCDDESACGDKEITGDEVCDDGNSEPGDGCSAQCDAIENGFACPTPGKACVSTIVCGDGHIGGEEQCDDSNTKSGDGCDAKCEGVEEGWSCPVVGARCVPAECGDGLVVGGEQCDTGMVSDPGCVACKLQDGYKCEVPGAACEITTCGDGVKEGTEQCDDGNNDLGDGCTTLCEREPTCLPPAPCTTECGDGIKLGSEKCDDGNTLDGDGCSATCTVEAGYTCSEGAADTLELPIVYRDFKYYKDGGHVDFQWSSGDPINLTQTQDIWVRTELGTAADKTPDGTSLKGKPIFKWWAECDGDGCSDITTGTQPAGTGDAADCNGVEGGGTGPRLIDVDDRDVYFCGTGTKDFNSFSQWYKDDDTVNKTIPKKLRLTECVDNASTPDYAVRCPGGAANTGDFVFDSNAASDLTYIGSGGGFFPINGEGFATGNGNNFSFTSELRYWFKYDAASQAQLTFRGDDDVWVFVNGQLVVDISGTHGATERSVIINKDTTSLTPAGAGPKLNLVNGEVYEIVVFQAERNENASNYRLQLANFSLGTSVCTTECGDGIVAGDETCDDGVNDGSYGSCSPTCQLGPRCGDNVKQADEGEACDDGANLTPYDKNGDGGGCAPECKLPAKCGDKKVDSLFGEQCDDGKNDGGFGECQPGCKLGSRCGDGKLEEAAGEECDDGNNIGNDGCTPSCKIEIIK